LAAKAIAPFSDGRAISMWRLRIMDAMTEYFLKRFFPAQFIELGISNRGIQKKLGFVSLNPTYQSGTTLLSASLEELA
jgi:hypothetical protein